MKTILAPIDFSDATSPVLEAATMLARAFHAKIVIAHVIRPAVITDEFSPNLINLEVGDRNREEEQLSYWRQELQNDGLPVEARELYGQPAACIRDEAKRLGADVIVVGSHGHGAVYDLLIGSTAADLLKAAPCPILVIPVSGLAPATSPSTAEEAVSAETPSEGRPGEQEVP